jgi:hypothetical protein
VKLAVLVTIGWIVSCWTITFVISRRAFLIRCQQLQNVLQIETVHAQAFTQVSHHCLWRCPSQVSEHSRRRMWITRKPVDEDLVKSNFSESSWSRGIGHIITPSLNFWHRPIDLHSFHCSIFAYYFQSAVHFLEAVLLFHQEFDELYDEHFDKQWHSIRDTIIICPETVFATPGSCHHIAKCALKFWRNPDHRNRPRMFWVFQSLYCWQKGIISRVGVWPVGRWNVFHFSQLIRRGITIHKTHRSFWWFQD